MGTFYALLNIKDIIDSDYTHKERVCKDLKISNFWEYDALHVQNDTILLPNEFENFRKMGLEIYQLDPALFLRAPGLAWQAALRKTKIKLDLLTDINILLMVQKCIRSRICHALHEYAKADNNYMRKHDKIKESSYLMY